MYIIICIYKSIYIKLNFDRIRQVIAFIHRKPNGQYVSERHRL